MKKKLLFGIVVVALIASLGMVLAAPTVNVLNGNQWTVLNKAYLPNGKGNLFVAKPSTIPDGGGIQFNLPNTEGTTLATTTSTRYLLTNYNGVLTGKTITADINLVITSGTVRANPNPLVHGPPTARVEFQTTTDGTYQYTDYWWYKPGVDLTGTGPTTVTGTITASTSELSNWIDINGQTASSLPTAFANALANVKQVSISFGSDNYYAGGVCVTPGGSAVFQLTSYTITP